MTKPDIDKAFTGSIPELYNTYLVPLIFEAHALDLANRVAARGPMTVLEIAAGTGVVTRALSAALPEHVSLVATDLNPAMLDYARSLPGAPRAEWQQADAMLLPFDDRSFDVVVCQFGAMFFPDKVKAFSEARRVLRRGGAFIFNVWDRIEENEFANEVTDALGAMFPHDPPRFLARTPHGYYDRAQIAQDLEAGEFPKAPQIATVTARSRAASPRVPAVAYCEGTPLRNEIEMRDSAALPRAIERCTDAIARRFGSGPVEGRIQAHIVVATA